MELFDDVIIKKTGQGGTIVDEGFAANGRHYFTVQLDNAAEIDEPWADLPYCWDDEIEPV